MAVTIYAYIDRGDEADLTRWAGLYGKVREIAGEFEAIDADADLTEGPEPPEPSRHRFEVGSVPNGSPYARCVYLDSERLCGLKREAEVHMVDR